MLWFRPGGRECVAGVLPPAAAVDMVLVGQAILPGRALLWFPPLWTCLACCGSTSAAVARLCQKLGRANRLRLSTHSWDKPGEVTGATKTLWPISSTGLRIMRLFYFRQSYS